MKRNRGIRIGVVLVGAMTSGLLAGAWLGRGSKTEEEVDGMLREAERMAANAVPYGAPRDDRRAANDDPMAPESRTLRGIPPYPKVSPRKLVGTTRAQGIPLAVSWFTTSDLPETVLAFYEAQFMDAGIPYVSHRTSPSLGYVAYLEEEPEADAGPGEGLLRMVTAVGSASTTNVLVSVARPTMLDLTSTRLPQGLVLPERATESQLVEMGEGAQTRSSVVTTVAGSLTEVATAYQQRLTHLGYGVSDEVKTGERVAWVARKDEMLMMVSVTQPSAGQVRVLVNYGRR